MVQAPGKSQAISLGGLAAVGRDRDVAHLVVVSNSNGKMMSLLLQIWQMKPRWVHRSQL